MIIFRLIIDHVIITACKYLFQRDLFTPITIDLLQQMYNIKSFMLNCFIHVVLFIIKNPAIQAGFIFLVN